MNVALVIPAAGSGQRLGMGIPKALAPIDGIPLLRCTLERLAMAVDFVETVVLAPVDSIATFESVLAGPPASLGLVRVLPGGMTRQASVAAGVGALSIQVDLVVVHDAARPLVSAATVRAVLEAAAAAGAATAASRPFDSVRRDDPGGASIPLDRATLWLVETPQAFRRDVLAAAHVVAANSGVRYTDDASLVEAVGQQVRVVESAGRNLKITTDEDLALAGMLLHRSRAAR